MKLPRINRFQLLSPAAIPALLKTYRGVHEVISTIMFNSIAIYMVIYLVNVQLSGFAPGASLEPQTAAIQATARFGPLNHIFQSMGWRIGNHVYPDYSLVVAVIMGMVVHVVIFRSPWGFEVRAVGTTIEA